MREFIDFHIIILKFNTEQYSKIIIQKKMVTIKNSVCYKIWETNPNLTQDGKSLKRFRFNVLRMEINEDSSFRQTVSDTNM